MGSIGTDQSSFAIGFAFPILGGTCVGLRFYTRYLNKAERKIDDWLTIPALLCVTGDCICLLIRAFEDSFASPDPVLVAQVLGALAIFWAFANALIKLSILFFYRRVFVGRVFNICTWTLIGLSIFWLIYDTACWLLYCGTDVRANFEGPWDNCPFWAFQIQIPVFALDSFIDLCILILPIPFVWNLQLCIAKRAGLIVIFLLGGFTFVAGLSNTVVQIIYLTQPQFAEDAIGGSFFQGTSILIYNWPSLEVGVGLIACNLPSLSFRVVSSLPQQVKHAWDISVTRIREHTSMWSVRSSSQGGERTSNLRSTETNDSRIDEMKGGYIAKVWVHQSSDRY